MLVVSHSGKLVKREQREVPNTTVKGRVLNLAVYAGVDRTPDVPTHEVLSGVMRSFSIPSVPGELFFQTLERVERELGKSPLVPRSNSTEASGGDIWSEQGSKQGSKQGSSDCKEELVVSQGSPST